MAVTRKLKTCRSIIKLVDDFLNVENQGRYYVDDGCQTENDGKGDDLVGSFKPKSFRAGVRCCTINGSSCMAIGSCPATRVTYDYAVLLCAQERRRLCTKDELLSDICCRTGKNCNSFAVWTSTSYEVTAYPTKESDANATPAPTQSPTDLPTLAPTLQRTCNEKRI